MMSIETREKLMAAGRFDLIKAYDVTQSGYAGILRNGNIVDRREHPEAIPIPENKMLGVPPVKPLPEKSDGL